MTQRISVVLSQFPQANPANRALEEDLVVELLLEHNIEVTLVPHLASLQPGDTGTLCLEGIKGEMIVLSWLDSVEARELLSKMKIQGRVGRTLLASDSKTTESPSGFADHVARTIYYIDLRLRESAAPYCQEIKRIRDEAAVRTFELNVVGEMTRNDHVEQQRTGDRASSSAAPERSEVTPIPRDKPEPSPPRRADTEDDNSPIDRCGHAAEQPLSEEETLDALVDELDEMDI